MASIPGLVKHPNVDDWLAIGPNGRVTVRSGKVDIGQRVSTALALIAAEELDVEFHRVDFAGADTDTSPDVGYTSASNSMQETGETIRLASATAKRHLLRLAAEMLEVEPSSLEVIDGLIRSRATNRSTTYWELLGDKPFGIAVDVDVVSKAPAEYRQIGQRVVPLGFEGLVDGSARFVHDMAMPGLLHARVIRPPHYHARLCHLDDAVRDRLGNARLVQDGSFLAVAAEDEYFAIKAADRVASAVRWEPERGLACDDVYERLLTNPRVSLPVHNGEAIEEPVPPRPPPPSEAMTTLEFRFKRPYLMHGSIGPSAALALYKDGTLTIWTHTQGVHPLRETLAEALGMEAASVRLIHGPGPGCYGHNGADDAALDAALVAKALPGNPVLLKWTREDEHAWEPYGPCMVVEVRASLDRDGQVIDWSHESYSDTHRTRPRPGPNRVGPARLLAMRHVSSAVPPFVPEPALSAPLAGIHRNADPLYTFSNRRIVKHLVRNMPLRTSTLRTLGGYVNVLAIESMMDELASAADADPLEFRLRNLDDERARAVLEAAAERAGWRRRRKVPGRGQGLGFARYNNLKTYAAVIVELEVDDAAEVHLRRAVIAADAGQVVDAAGLSLQLEGGLLQAASWMLYEEVTWDERGITSRDWDSYPILRFDNVPEVETVLVDRPEMPSLGAGEASVAPSGAAIANAIYDATGLRLRRLPFTPDAIRAAALN